MAKELGFSLLQAMVYTNINMLKKGNKKIIIEFKLKGETFYMSVIDGITVELWSGGKRIEMSGNWEACI